MGKNGDTAYVFQQPPEERERERERARARAQNIETKYVCQEQILFGVAIL